MKKPLFVKHNFKPQEFKPHFHNYYSIGLITNGEHNLNINNKKQNIKGGELKIINPNELHYVDKNSIWSYINLIIPPKDIYNITMLLQKEINNKEIKFSNCIDNENTIKKFTKLLDSYYSNLDFKKCYIEFIKEILENHSILISKNIEKSKKIDVVLEYISKNYLEDISLDKVANILGVSKFYAIKIFKGYTNFTPHQYIMRLRIEKAIELISNNIPLSQVALHCGFSDQSHFIKEFKKIYGFTPAELNNI